MAINDRHVLPWALGVGLRFQHVSPDALEPLSPKRIVSPLIFHICARGTEHRSDRLYPNLDKNSANFIPPKTAGPIIPHSIDVGGDQKAHLRTHLRNFGCIKASPTPNVSALTLYKIYHATFLYAVGSNNRYHIDDEDGYHCCRM